MKKLKHLRTLIIFTVLISLFSCSPKIKTAKEIYDECLNNVVEIKASSEDIGESFGTGEIVSNEGQIITNAHVVTYKRMGVTQPFEKLYMRFSFEEDYRELELVKYDLELDLAELKIKDITGLDLKPIKLEEEKELDYGDKVYAIGNASNYGIGIFEGIVSVPLVNIELDELVREVIQCDITIAAGNSGGALLNENGNLVGITTFRTKDNFANVIYGIVYCIPINIVIDYLNIEQITLV